MKRVIMVVLMGAGIFGGSIMAAPKASASTIRCYDGAGNYRELNVPRDRVNEFISAYGDIGLACY